MSPPTFKEILPKLLQSKGGIERYQNIATQNTGPAQEGKYRHWDILRHLQPPGDLTSEEWWVAVKIARNHLYQPLPFTDKTGKHFQYAMLDILLRMLSHVDRNASGTIKGGDQVTNPHTRDNYLFKSLVEESITSSQLEGAATTRDEAKDMIQTGRSPKDRGEQMIYNNYMAMQFIRRLERQPLTPATILELQGILTLDTLHDPDASGRLRRADEPIVIEDEQGNLLHTPPHADTLEQRIEEMCAFANNTTEGAYIHPVIRAILLHFWLAYDHPFVDGNGRTARALFYWSMVTQEYWLTEFISISRVIKKAPSRYYRSFLYTETDDADVTYFLLNQLKVIIEAINDLHEYLAIKTQEIRETERFLRSSKAVNTMLNHRQLAIVNHALKHPTFQYTIESHRRSHNVSYQTARTDLLELAKYRLLDQLKFGKSFLFLAPPDLRERLQKFKAPEPVPDIVF
jgi:Fic family protein